ncbi:MAG: glutamine--fructose-6-phosphate transaminase (isomerizing) [archaeon]|jgi:glucosamine--fructose-6-phosphate aminotransferase (isomerizing)
MCGIVGYVGKGNALDILMPSIERLEYRGYDSVGIAVSTGTEIIQLKKKGKVKTLEEAVKLLKNKNQINLGIAHTRWATHGEPSEINAHPHSDSKKEISIVHNGIIENYSILKKMLEDEGYQIISETDSEIIAHLIAKFYTTNLEKAVMQALSLIEGSYALAIISKKEDKLIIARNGSPLAIGIGDGEYFVASDVTAFLEYTSKVIYLEDYEMAVLDKNNCVIKNFKGEEIFKEVIETKLKIDQIKKGNYKHFMLKEIFEQPNAVQNCLRGRIKNNKVRLSINIDFSKITRIIFVACGTSWHACLVGKYILENILPIPIDVEYASEFRYKKLFLKKTDLVIALSQSGETADTIEAIKQAKKYGAKTLGIVNVVGSTISRQVDSGIFLYAGPEIAVASTKAFSTQITALLLLSIYAQESLKQKANQALINELKIIPEKIKEVFASIDQIKKIANELKDAPLILFLGRGINFPVILEGVLKLKEISYVFSEGFPAGEIKHGPIALIDKDVPVIFVATKNNQLGKTINAMQEVKARGAKIISIVNSENTEINMLSDYVYNIPPSLEEISPLLSIIPLQLFAYYVADAKGLDVDRPRNLAKSVTVE